MGLDMGLMKKKKGRGNSKTVEIAYWRKANQIHNWFVKNVAKSDPAEWDGEIEVTKEQLQDLLATCNTVLGKSKLVKAKIKNGTQMFQTKRGIRVKPFYEKGKKILFPRVAKKLLPTCDGFFFGNTDYDEYYIEDLKSTVEQLEKVLTETDFDNYKVLYYAWW